MGGRCNNSVKRVVRSTSVPIAEVLTPKSRSPSQWPGTARSTASAGRSLIMMSGVTNALPRPHAGLSQPSGIRRAVAGSRVGSITHASIKSGQALS